MADPTRRSNPLAAAMGVLAALAVIVTGFLGYVGWFGGRPPPPRRRPH